MNDSPDYQLVWDGGLLPGYSHNIALSSVKPHSPCRSPALKQI